MLSSFRQVVRSNRYQVLAEDDEKDEEEDEEQQAGSKQQHKPQQWARQLQVPLKKNEESSSAEGRRTTCGSTASRQEETNEEGARRRRRWGERLGAFREIVPSGVNSVEEQEWEEIEMAVDSGATETVVGEDMLESIETKEGAAYRRGVEYEVANGERVANLGEKKFTCYSNDGQKRGMTAQVCDVNKALLSVRRLVQAGNKVVFDSTGGYIEDEQTGEQIKMKEEGGMYMLKLWVQRPFQGQAQ